MPRSEVDPHRVFRAGYTVCAMHDGGGHHGGGHHHGGSGDFIDPAVRSGRRPANPPVNRFLLILVAGAIVMIFLILLLNR